MFNSIFITVKWQDITRHSLTVVVMFLSHMYPDRTTTWKIWQYLGFTFITRGQFWPSVIVVACVCSSVSPSVTKFVRAITHHPFKLGSPNLDQRCKRVKIPIVLWDNWSWASRSNCTPKSKFTPFWACPGHNSPPIEVTISKFGTKMHLSTVQIPTNFGLDWNWSSIQFLISNTDQIELFMYIIGIL